MQHKPVGDDDNSCKEAKLPYRTEVHTKPDKAEQTEIGQRRQGYGGSDLAETETYPHRDRKVEGDGEDSFRLR